MIPRRASDAAGPSNLPDAMEAYITNPYAGKNLLTVNEALDAINILSGQLVVDTWQREETHD